MPDKLIETLLKIRKILDLLDIMAKRSDVTVIAVCNRVRDTGIFEIGNFLAGGLSIMPRLRERGIKICSCLCVHVRACVLPYVMLLCHAFLKKYIIN